nr:hypothetical protein [uncultured Trichococcus sp.]
MAKKYDCILIDIARNKSVGRFNTMQEALKYAREEGLKTVTWEFLKE